VKNFANRSRIDKVIAEINRVSAFLDHPGTFCYPTVQTAPCYVPSFWHNTGVWQTDRHTELP